MTFKATINIRKTTKQIIVIRLLSITLLVGALFAVFLSPLIFRNVFQTSDLVIIYLFIMGMLYLLFKKDYFKSTEKNGIIELNALQLMVKQEKENTIYLLSEITDLRINFNSYKDMQIGKARFDGDDNNISFRYNGVKNELQFDVDSLQHLEELKGLFGAFYKKGIQFKEYYMGQRSFMHRTNLSFKEVQEFKAKYNAEWA